jgi:hypothetical protein
MKAATGDYDAADQDLVAMAAAVPGLPGPASGPSLPPRAVVAAALAGGVLSGPLGIVTPAGALVPAATWPPTLTFASLLTRDLAHREDLTVFRGLLALEAGNVEKAEALFREAVGRWSTSRGAAAFDFPARPVAQEYLRRMAAARAEPPPEGSRP